MRISARLAAMTVAALALAGACAAALQPQPALQAAPAPALGPERTVVTTVLPPGPGWAKDRSDLPSDPDYTLGVLPNGMRYLILTNKNPPKQVAMRLVISAGSMQERKGEEGIAHFLEHLAFRGTKQFPDGELQRRLEGLGLQMGTDANASTGPDSTIFMFNLAHNDAESLDTGLLLFREIVSEMRIDPDLVNAERGVVLAEERARAGPAEDAAEAALKLQVGDHPYGRPPIGIREIIEKLTPAQIRVFYDAYYRPERATLVIVGDTTAKELIPAIEKHFNDWQGRGEAGKDPTPLVKKPKAPDVAVLVTPGVGDTSLTLRWFQPYEEQAVNRIDRRKDLIEYLGASAVSLRVPELYETAGKPARSVAAAFTQRIPKVWEGQVSAASGVTNLSKTIELMVKIQKQAVEYGISQAELDRAIALRLDNAKQAASTGRTGQSAQLAESRARSIVADPIYMSARDSAALLEQQIKTVTLDEVNAALRARFTDTPILIYRGPKPPDGGEAALRATFAKAMAAPVQPYSMEPVKPWPYVAFGSPGKVAQRTEDAELGVTFVRFENGVRLTVKRTDFQKDDVLVNVRLGLGRLGMPRDKINAADMGVAVWRSGGLGKLTLSQQAQTLAGKRVAVSVDEDDDAYEVSNLGNSGSVAPDFALQMQLLAATVADPGLRTDLWPTMLAAADQAEESIALTPTGVIGANLDPLLHSGDLRWTFDTKAQRDSWKPSDAAAYIKPIIASAPIEVTVVGDIDVEMAISETAKTFGAMPARKAAPEPKGLRNVKFPKGGEGPVVLAHKGRADQGGFVIAWPTTDKLSDPRAARIGWVLSQMLRDDATRKFRSENGQTYSPFAISEFSDTLPGYGYIGLQMEIPPQLEDSAIADIQAIAAKLASDPVPYSEVTRITGPRTESIKRQRATNRYWLAGLEGVQTDARKLEQLRLTGDEYADIIPEDVLRAAKAWLKPETEWKVKAVPEAMPN